MEMTASHVKFNWAAAAVALHTATGWTLEECAEYVNANRIDNLQKFADAVRYIIRTNAHQIRVEGYND